MTPRDAAPRPELSGRRRESQAGAGPVAMKSFFTCALIRSVRLQRTRVRLDFTKKEGISIMDKNPFTPMIVVSDDTNQVGDLLLAAMRQADGHAVRIHVKDHDITNETLVALLPQPGPSLAAALRNWVDTWWDDEDAVRHLSIEKYLQGFGVVMEPSDFAACVTSCPYCNARHTMYVVGGTFSAMGMALNYDGFAFSDASGVDTDDLEVECEACHRVFPYAEVML